MKWKRGWRGALTAVLGGLFVLRLLRFLESPESVLRFFFGGSGGAVWTLFGGLFLLGPFAVNLAAAALPWLRQRTARPLGGFCCLSSGFFALEEGLTLFARGMNGHASYAGACPGLSAAVSVLSGLIVGLGLWRGADSV